MDPLLIGHVDNATGLDPSSDGLLGDGVGRSLQYRFELGVPLATAVWLGKADHEQRLNNMRNPSSFSTPASMSYA